MVNQSTKFTLSFGLNTFYKLYMQIGCETVFAFLYAQKYLMSVGWKVSLECTNFELKKICTFT